VGLLRAGCRGDRPDPRPRGLRRRSDALAGRASASRRPRPLRSHARGGDGGLTFEEARAQFPVLERYAYLNAGTNGPLARATVEAMAEFDRRDLERGRGGKAYFEEILALRERAREALAGVLEVDPENVALVSSTTNACNVVLAGLGLTGEDEIVTTDIEHFGLLGPLLASPAKVRVACLRDSRPDEAHRALARVLGDGQLALSRRASPPAGAVDPRRRGAIRRHLPNPGRRI